MTLSKRSMQYELRNRPLLDPTQPSLTLHPGEGWSEDKRQREKEKKEQINFIVETPSSHPVQNPIELEN
eukprot:g34214.t1